MYEMKLFLVILIIVVIVGLLIFISVFSYRWLIKKGYNKARFILPFMTLATTLFFIYPAIYPNDKFYKKEFEDNTSILFPNSGVIIKKDATYPDIHGDYTARAIIRLSKPDYKDIYSKLKADNVFKVDTNTNHFLIETVDFLKSKNINDNTLKFILIGVRKAQFKIGFIIDGETIIFERHSS